MTNIIITGFDPSLRNWGYAVGHFCVETRKLIIPFLGVIQPVLPTGKQVRQNSLDIEASKQLMDGCLANSKGAAIVFAEAPVGSQSARAMLSVGVCMGIIGALKCLRIPIIEITPTEVKVAAVGTKTATKHEMIAWATKQHPEANWPMVKRNGVLVISEAKAEHMADAIAAIYAGLKTTEFQLLERSLCKLI